MCVLQQPIPHLYLSHPDSRTTVSNRQAARMPCVCVEEVDPRTHTHGHTLTVSRTCTRHAHTCVLLPPPRSSGLSTPAALLGRRSRMPAHAHTNTHNHTHTHTRAHTHGHVVTLENFRVYTVDANLPAFRARWLYQRSRAGAPCSCSRFLPRTPLQDCKCSGGLERLEGRLGVAG